MNLILYLRELWRRRLLVILSVVVAAVISVLAVFQMSFSPPSVSKRSQVEAQGSIEILVDSARSPIADARRDLSGLAARAGVFARYMAGGNVIGQIARINDIPVKQIDVVGPAPLAGEAPGADQESPQLHPYGIAISQPDELLPILSVVTRAPTVREARGLAAAAPRSVSHAVMSIQTQQGTPLAKRVQFRVLGPAQAALVDDALGKKVAAMLFLFLLVLAFVLILGLPRLAAAWRKAESDAQPSGMEDESDTDEPQQGPEVLHLPDGRGSESHDDDARRVRWSGWRGSADRG